ncbi:methyl-accepting chemotaxis protein [Vibrio aestuarianus]|uniref:methyl-accepting chemotaxis protein n=1 Tax=Vibrio aestuarianus TaxID=28171 RepID=UPI00144639C6|nr:methyl-accepting chemotaxis protein [Vibrio aestuarianus]MDE1214284.1 methyl-accepting chemotaxis protein [Vibrio aestuarianus]MDE1219325.1 methyl-accepting chemotaxis protein [Vibrio aestuarianus]MDE1261268.1 methyl-accepting chemotaxis protein [Vibrio aestuarianus]MDE1268650.1 methyl-accepting chemotaxis protein [Vibrio aestuarianus]MDE1275572.1 methyl-accepting chemotaxis protein [Vibrio aestuarianus]
MNIKQKLYSLGVVAIAGVISILLTSSHFAKTTDELNQAINLVAKLEISLLNLRRNEKDFLLREDLKYLETFKKNSDLFLTLEKQLSPILSNRSLPSSSQLRQDLIAYKQGFEKLAQAYIQYGLNDKAGIRGRYLQALELAKMNSDDQELVALIAFDKMAQSGKYAPTESIDSIFPNLKQTALQLIEHKKIVGLQYNQGLLGEARNLSHAVETQFSSFSETLSTEVDRIQVELNYIKNGVTLLVIAFILVFILQISRSINIQVSKLLTVMQMISSTNNISLRVKLEGKNELVSIGNYFNTLLDKFELLIASSQTKSQQLSSSTSSMHNELEDVIEQFHVQADHTTTMATAVQEMVATIGEISESTSIAVEGVHQAAKNAQSGRTVVESTVKNVDQLSRTLEKSQHSISSLNKHVEQIGGAVTIIQAIAEQTNLLALNAAIEAARAGEQGRGFAVVADEVRALASRTHQSTEEITNVVSAIQTQMSTVVTDIAQCNTQGHETLDASSKLDQSLRQIITDMEMIQSNSERIASAIEEQGIVMNQVSESITELNSISDNNMHSAKQCLAEVDIVSKQAHEMDSAVAEFQTEKTAAS